ncbi:AAA family ATPase [Pseudophaeobacter sp.]|uniref:AAA family ATPase n=1 Tax=Pseudophaeobacter sp. TaxID=1971739 RepID=UPI003299A622
MKICAIRLQNIRRFTEAVEITGIGPGLNVLAAPNEQGKSTIFDALHAVFFKDAKSWDKEIRALAPRAGGEPRIEVEIDCDGTRYRLVKQFQKASGKGEIRIWQGDTLFLQSDAAEAWLQDLIKSPKDGGPAGLLWVRQGLTDFADAKETLSARQDLLSSITGEVDAVTGGQRMDAIRRDLRQSLDRLVTSRGAKKGGALDLAATEVAQLQADEQRLQARVQELRSQLDQRGALRAELAGLQEADTQQELEARMQAARQALAAAERYQEKLDTSAAALKTARLIKENHQSTVQGLRARQQEHMAALAECEQAQSDVAEVATRLTPAEQRLRECLAQSAADQDALRQAEVLLARVQRAAVEAQEQAQRQTLSKTVAQARAAQAQVTELTQQARQGPDRKAMDRIEAAREALGLAEQAQHLAAPAITVTYEAGQEGRLRLDGQAVAAGERLSLPRGGQIEALGLGRIALHPGQATTSDQLAVKQAELAAALAYADCAEVAEARARHRSREEAAIRLQQADVQLQALAPEGLLALINQLDSLGEHDSLEERAAEGAASAQPPEPPELPERTTVEADLSRSRAAMDQSSAALEAARAQEATLRLGFEGANARHQAAQQRLERAKAALAGEVDAAVSLAVLEQQATALQEELNQAQAQLELLQQAAPDLAAVQARVVRAKSAQEAVMSRLQELGRDLAVLDTRIGTTAGEAVEEELAEVSDQLLAAQDRLAAVEFEVAVLRRLDLALDQARSAAQEAYVAPVLKELQPLLRHLWPDAQLQVDADRVLPHHLHRDTGGGEDFESLSGGTQEQIALLVRLAFARLLARSGEAAPVILDDAIVYTDDARIERLFDALTLQSSDLQILVFTCRQKSFRALGGTQLAIRSVQTA